MDYAFHILILLGIYAILSTSLNLLATIGTLSVAHGTFFGLGAYIFALSCKIFCVPPLQSLLLACAITGVTGYILAFPSLRIRGDYFALSSFGLAVVGYDIFNNLTAITGGPMGMDVASDMGFSRNYNRQIIYSVFSLGCLTINYILTWRLLNSPWGRIVHAIREREAVVTLTGRRPNKYKLVTVAFASFWAGCAGSIYASYLTYIHPSNFLPMTSILLLCMVIIGGVGSLNGSIVGAFVFVVVPELLRFLQVPYSIAGNINELLFGLALVVFMLFRPQGILGKHRILNE